MYGCFKNMETRNFRAKVLIRKMSITKLAHIENGDSISYALLQHLSLSLRLFNIHITSIHDSFYNNY